jgi:hypothetical protein
MEPTAPTTNDYSQLVRRFGPARLPYAKRVRYRLTNQHKLQATVVLERAVAIQIDESTPTNFMTLIIATTHCLR